MNRSQLATILTGSAILATAVGLAAWPDPSAENSKVRAVSTVTVVQVRTTSEARLLRLSGVTRAADRARLSFAVPARLATRPVEVGDAVRPGQVLGTLDDREYRLAERAATAALAELEVRLTQARRDLERVERLVANEAATDEELERMLASVGALEAAHDAAAARLAETSRLTQEGVLHAPFAGTVTAVHLEPGEWVSPGAPVVEIAGSGAVEVVVEAPEAVRSGLVEGAEVTVDLPFQERKVRGTVTAIAAAAAGPGHLFPVEVTLDRSESVAAGLTAEVVFSLKSKPELVVPLEAVLNPGSSRPAVFRVADGRVSLVPVRLGRVTGDGITVQAELTDGDRVAVSGHTAIADGDTVEVSR